MVPFDKWVAFKGNFPKNAGQHRMVIMHKVDDRVSYFYVTSYETSEERRKIDLNNRNDAGSVAELERTDWDTLTKNSCIQCNRLHIHEIALQDIITGYENGEIEYIGVVPEIVKNKIISATCASMSFTDTEKAIYTIS